MPTKTLEMPVPETVLEDVLSGPIIAEPERRVVPAEEKARPSRPEADSVLDRLHRLGEPGRLAAYRAGELDRHERSVWAATYPDEVPLINGELEWLVCSLADLD